MVSCIAGEQNKMPIDYQSYLLSASPPGFDLHYAIRDHYPRRTEKSIGTVSSASVITSAPAKTPSSYFQPYTSTQLSTTVTTYDRPEEFDKTVKNDFKPISPSPSKSKLGKVKRVSFADDLGGQLVQIRLLTQRPNSPPTFNPEVLSSLTDGSSADAFDLPPFKLNFSQPASDYVAFRDKLEHNCVALENVILKHYDIIGTVKVKNIAFEKKVTVRYSTDHWHSFTNVGATYVPTTSRDPVPYDTFSFELNISPKMNIKDKFEFAVMYQVKHEQFWDNNSGNNYEVLSSDWSESKRSEVETLNTTDRKVFRLGRSSDWTEFCGWSNMTESVPYY